MKNDSNTSSSARETDTAYERKTGLQQHEVHKQLMPNFLVPTKSLNSMHLFYKVKISFAICQDSSNK